jgi:hypothetical protein
MVLLLTFGPKPMTFHGKCPELVRRVHQLHEQEDGVLTRTSLS